MGASSKAADLSFKVVTVGLGLATIYSITAFSINYYNGRTKRQVFIEKMEQKKSINKKPKQAEEQKRQEPR